MKQPITICPTCGGAAFKTRKRADNVRKLDDYEYTPAISPEMVALLAAVGKTLRETQVELDALRTLVGGECPIGSFDLITSLRSEKAAMQEELEDLHNALPDPDELLALADWLDLKAGVWGTRPREVRYDLREWAGHIMAVQGKIG